MQLWWAGLRYPKPVSRLLKRSATSMPACHSYGVPWSDICNWQLDVKLDFNWYKKTIISYLVTMFYYYLKIRFFKHSQELSPFNRNPSTGCHLAHIFFAWISLQRLNIWWECELEVPNLPKYQIDCRTPWVDCPQELVGHSMFELCSLNLLIYREVLGRSGKALARLTRDACRSRIDSCSWQERSRWLISTHC